MMRQITIHDPANTRGLVLRDGRPVGAAVIGMRQREGEELVVTIALDREDTDTPAERIDLPASQVWVDTAWQERWATAESAYRLSERLRQAAEDAREVCTCGHVRRRHHRGGVDDAGCTDCECEGYADGAASRDLELRDLRSLLDQVVTCYELATGPMSALGPIPRMMVEGFFSETIGLIRKARGKEAPDAG